MENHNKGADDSANIRVICRMRPMNALEKSTGGETCIEFDENKIKCKVSGNDKPHEFTFDRVFGPGIAQKDIFEVVASPVIESVMAGYNGTIFCYGQTSSGKTFTMEGPDDLTPETKGLIPRMMDRVFDIIVNASEDLEFQIRVSFLEIYNEKVQDLLDPDKNNLQIKENKARGIYVQDATEIYVTSAAEMHQVMKTGSSNRTIAATRMNERSSRSHSMFYLQVYKKNLSTDTTTISKLYFVDLAGSEKISKTNVSGQQLEEAKNINKSLTCLGMVINALTSNGKEHVPYRDSKLTRILQESLGGNARTTLVINISMCSYNDKETLGTLRFGFRAKSIKNKPKKNEEKSAKELMALLDSAESKIKYQEEIISTLQLQLNCDRSSIDTLKSIDNNERKDSITANIKPVNKIPKHESTDQSASMKLLKQHIELVKMKEKVENLTRQVTDHEMDTSNRQAEISGLREDKEELSKMLKEQVDENQQIKQEFQEVINEVRQQKDNANSDIEVLIHQFRRLKQDLSYFLISEKSSSYSFEQTVEREEGRQGDESGDRTPAESRRISESAKCSIDKAIEMIESIAQKYHIQIGYEASSEQMIGNSQMNEQDILKIAQNSTSIQISPQIDTSAKNNLLSNLASQNPTDRLSLLLLSNAQKTNITNNEYKEFLSTDEDDIRLQTQESEIEYKLFNDDLEKDYIDIIVEKDEEQDENNDIEVKETESDEILKANQNIATIMEKFNHNEEQSKIDEQLLSLQETIHNQNQRIKYLTEQCVQASAKIEGYKQSLERKQNKYKQKLLQQRKFVNEKLKKYEEIIQTYFSIFKETSTQKMQYEKQIIEKNIQINELKEFVDDFKKNVKNKSPQQTITELQAKIKELLKERKELYSEQQKLRKEVDFKEEKLKIQEKDISSIKENFLRSGLPSSQAMSEYSPKDQIIFSKKFSQESPSQSASNRLTSFLQQQQQQEQRINERNQQNSSQGSGSNYPIKMSVKSMIKPSIRGGGGSKSNFEKNNSMIFQTLLEEDELLDRQSSQNSKVNSINTFKEENSSPLHHKNMKIINTEEEESRPQAFNLHKSASKFQQKIRNKNIVPDDSSSSSLSSSLNNSSKARQNIQQQQNVNQINQDNPNQTDSGIFNRIKRFFL